MSLVSKTRLIQSVVVSKTCVNTRTVKCTCRHSLKKHLPDREGWDSIEAQTFVNVINCFLINWVQIKGIYFIHAYLSV